MTAARQTHSYPSEDVRRSWLLVPPTDQDMVARCWSHGADVIVLDLVGMVTEGAKPAARELLRDAIGVAERGGAQVFSQIDAELLYADLAACVWPGP